MTSRIESIKARLAATTPSHYRDYQWPFVLVERNPDWDFIDHAPQDLRDLLDLYDDVKIYFDYHGPDYTERCAQYERVQVILSRLDSPVGDEGAE